MHQTRILVVDDDPAIAKFLRANLAADGYEVLLAADGTTALNAIEKEAPDMVLLDIMLPKPDGFEICRRVREWSRVPIIMVSARGDEEDKIKCLETGADDYITKPFGVGELTARVKAVLRRSNAHPAPANPTVFSCEDFEVDFVRRSVNVRETGLDLTPTEYNLLQYLVLNAGKVLTHTMLLQKVWGPEYGEEKQYLHVFISRLRKMLEPEPESPRYFITVPGVGYRFEK